MTIIKKTTLREVWEDIKVDENVNYKFQVDRGVGHILGKWKWLGIPEWSTIAKFEVLGNKKIKISFNDKKSYDVFALALEKSKFKFDVVDC